MREIEPVERIGNKPNSFAPPLDSDATWEEAVGSDAIGRRAPYYKPVPPPRQAELARLNQRTRWEFRPWDSRKLCSNSTQARSCGFNVTDLSFSLSARTSNNCLKSLRSLFNFFKAAVLSAVIELRLMVSFIGLFQYIRNKEHQRGWNNRVTTPTFTKMADLLDNGAFPASRVTMPSRPFPESGATLGSKVRRIGMRQKPLLTQSGCTPELED